MEGLFQNALWLVKVHMREISWGVTNRVISVAYQRFVDKRMDFLINFLILCNPFVNPRKLFRRNCRCRGFYFLPQQFHFLFPCR